MYGISASCGRQAAPNGAVDLVEDLDAQRATPRRRAGSPTAGRSTASDAALGLAAAAAAGGQVRARHGRVARPARRGGVKPFASGVAGRRRGASSVVVAGARRARGQPPARQQPRPRAAPPSDRANRLACRRFRRTPRSLTVVRSLPWPPPSDTSARAVRAPSPSRRDRRVACRAREAAGAIIDFEDVVKRYPSGDLGLNGATFAIHPGEFVFIVGASGSGKSTLMRLLIKEVELDDGPHPRRRPRPRARSRATASRTTGATSGWSTRTSSCCPTAPCTTTSPTRCRSPAARAATSATRCRTSCA